MVPTGGNITIGSSRYFFESICISGIRVERA